MRTLAFLYLAVAAAAAGSDIQGTVTDPSGRAIRGARVECGGKSTTTDLEGRFTIEGADRCTAVVRAAGFETARASLASGAPAQIQLAIAPMAERVIVSATRRESTVEEAGVSATVFTRADLEARNAPQLADVLRETPGIEVARYGRPGSLTQLFTRGGQRTATLVLLDGVPLNDPGGEVNLGGFSSAGLDRVEVVRGPESALFGAEAASGVIQLFTARGNPEDRLPRGSVAYERGSFASDRWMANLGGGSGARFDYAVSAEQYRASGEYNNDYFRNTTGTANIGARVTDSTEVRAIFRSFDSALGVPNQVAYRIPDRDAHEDTRDYAAGIHVDDVRGPRFAQRISFGYHRSHDLFIDPLTEGPFDISALVRDAGDRVYFVRLLDAPIATPPPGTRVVTPFPVTLYGSDPFLSLTSRQNFDYQGTITHTGGAAVFGYVYDRQNGDITGREAARDNHGLFLHEQRAIGVRLFLSGGLRVERNSAFGTKATPRGAASLRVARSTFVRASAGIGITDPSLLQNFARDPFFVGNPDLRPEKTTSFEAGIVRELFGRRLRAEASAFHNSFRDLIVFVFLPVPEPSTWRNIEASKARGLEFSAEARPVPLLTIAGNYTRMWTRITRSNSPNSLFTGVGQELARRPGNAGAVSATLGRARWSLAGGAVFVGERQDIDLFGVTRNPGYAAAYATASLHLTHNLSPYVRVNNLTNERYQEVLGYPAPSRTVQGGIRIQW